MRKLIAAINVTLDGFCDHTAVDPDEEIHHHYADLLAKADVALYGRTTYQLMQYWQTLVENPSGEPALDDFAKSIDKIPKIVFSHTLKDTGWASAKIATQSLEETVRELKQRSGNDILVGSRSLIMQLLKLNLIDEYQLCFHPVVAGGGLPLFENLGDKTPFKLIKTRVFGSGAVLLSYAPANETSNP